MPQAQTWGQLVADAPESVGFQPLPEGDYDFKIVESEAKRSQSQKDGFKIVAEVESGPYKGQKLFNTFWVSPDSPVAMGIFFRHFAALGLDRAYFQTEPSNEKIVHDLVNRRFRGSVTQRDYNGGKQNDLKNVAAPSGPAPAAVVASPSPAVVSAPVPTTAPAVPTAAPTAAPNAPDAAWGSLPTPAAAPAPAAPAAPALPPLGPDNPPF